MTDKSKTPSFPVGQAGKREVKRLLLRSTNPAATITNFQKTRSLHSMFARAFGTTPLHAVADGGEAESSSDAPVESLDTDSVLTFLGHLGVSRFEVHKRIQDSLQKQLEEEIRKIGSGSQEPLLNLLKNCWHPATTVPELRPILWAVLKQLGEQTPPALLNALGEREPPDSQQLKHAEIFRPLPPLLKRLVWEADWDDKVPVSKEATVNNPKEYLSLVQSTLLHGTVQPLVDKYCSTEALLESAGKFFVTSALERRVLTTQRRALTSTSTTSSAGVSAATTTTTALLGKTAATGGTTQSSTSSPSEPLLNSGRAVSQLRQLLGDTAGGTASYRPKLLHALLSMLMAHHGAQAPKTLTGTHLHCTLVADILLSAGGPLPKIYTHIHALARILDDSVKNGVFSDKGLISVQETLKTIYAAEHSEQDDDSTNKPQKTEMKKKEKSEDVAKAAEAKPTTFLKRQLNRIITAGLQAMKESDPQNLFMYPVTDAIAPGYSKVIKKPMSISTMETKIENNVYNSIEEWSADVKLMFKNCADYNRGKAGQWFRGEAGRQLKVFKDEIVPQAKRLYQAEVKKRNPDDDDLKRKREDEPKTPEIVPLPAIAKKRKIVETQEYTLSMPALASMLLADPFVVRLLLDRVLRSLRIDVLRGSSIPVSHAVVPSLLQLLHMAKWSTQICAVRGQRYLVPDSGLVAPDAIEALEAMIPFDSLRRYLPVLMHLSLDAELDKRVAVGGDLNAVADSLPRTSAPTVELKKDSPPYQVSVALLEGLFIHVCLPGNSQDASLAGTFIKFSKTLQELAGTIWDERSFFVCLVPTILRYKARLNRTVRDTIISTWTAWLGTSDADDGNAKKKKKKGSMTSAGHEYLVLLFNEWASFGNLLLPRDLLLKVSLELVEAVNKTETATERQFLHLWKQEDAKDFEPIKKQYEKMLSLLPENHSSQWKETVGIMEPKPATDDVEEPKVESPSKSPEPMESDADKEKGGDQMEED
jgi:hypothetical protein